MDADFYVTGPMRSGTTYMASILNSQSESACIEERIHSRIRYSKLDSKESFDVLCGGHRSNIYDCRSSGSWAEVHRKPG